METGINLIKKEREEQIIKQGRTTELDIEYNSNCQLAFAAERLGVPELDMLNYIAPVNWDEQIWDKMISKPYKQRLIIAGALIAAELDRLSAGGEKWIADNVCQLYLVADFENENFK